jgi:hypothetical protein
MSVEPSSEKWKVIAGEVGVTATVCEPYAQISPFW